MHRVEIQVDRHPPGTADPRDHSHIILFQLKLLHRAKDAAHDNAYATPSTPQMGESLVMSQIFVYALIVSFHRYPLSS
jgi:hypothetical protein